ncbi:MAG: DUF423 domain-containing protein [Kiritimatiellae bacterium]|nr:DUF423 domain-containing protein [Kiritimatiellia bacterium]
MKTSRVILICAAVLGCAAVLLGAYGTHGLRPRLTPQGLASFETGVRYQMHHAIALLAIAWLATQRKNIFPAITAALWSIGVLCFSGSIYLLILRPLLALHLPNWFPLLTPLGGAFLILGWIGLIVAAVRE